MTIVVALNDVPMLEMVEDHPDGMQAVAVNVYGPFPNAEVARAWALTKWKDGFFAIQKLIEKDNEI